MTNIVLAKAAADDRSGLLLLGICAVLVLAGGIGASMLSAINITPPYGDILFVVALFVALFLTFPMAVWIEDKLASRRNVARLE